MYYLYPTWGLGQHSMTRHTVFQQNVWIITLSGMNNDHIKLHVRDQVLPPKELCKNKNISKKTRVSFQSFLDFAVADMNWELDPGLPDSVQCPFYWPSFTVRMCMCAVSLLDCELTKGWELSVLAQCLRPKQCSTLPKEMIQVSPLEIKCGIEVPVI